MKTPWLFSLVLALSTAAISIDVAEAKRLGSGRSFGMQRQIAPQRQALPPSTAPRQATPAPANAQPQTSPAQAANSGWRRWAAPLAGLAAGIGLAALMSHLGLGAEFGGLLLAVLAVIVVFALLRRVFGTRRANPPQPAYAGEQPLHYGESVPAPFARREFVNGGNSDASTAAEPAVTVPADFDVAGFLHHAKVNFVRLQAANDNCNLDDVREFTTPEMFAEIKLAIDERGCTPQKTDVIRVDAELLEVAEDGHQHVASVRYHGLVREEREAAPQAFDEVWHLVKPLKGSRGWSLAGIQQLS